MSLARSKILTLSDEHGADPLTSSDADSDVLADYVLALLKSDTHELQLRDNVITNLEDFLKDSKLGMNAISGHVLGSIG